MYNEHYFHTEATFYFFSLLISYCCFSNKDWQKSLVGFLDIIVVKAAFWFYFFASSHQNFKRTRTNIKKKTHS